MSEVPILPDEMMKTELQSVEGFYPLSSSFFLLGVEVDLRRSRLSSVWLGQVQDNGPWALSATVASLSKGKSRLPGPSGLSATSATHTDRSTRPNTLLCPEEHGGARRFCVRAAVLVNPFPFAAVAHAKQWDVKRCEQETGRKQQLSRGLTVLGRQHSKSRVKFLKRAVWTTRCVLRHPPTQICMLKP